MPKFLILIPTVRDRAWVAKNLENVYASLTYPTDVLVKDGTRGKSATLNHVLEKVLDPAEYSHYVTLDDDILLPYNWQHDVLRAFAVRPRLGAVGLDYSNTEEGRAYMLELNPEEVYEDVTIRPLHRQNIAGAIIVMPTQVAKSVGPYPLNGVTTYEFDEDGFRCMRVKQLGFITGYVVPTNGYPTMLHAPDTKEYLDKKAADIEYIQKKRKW
jgi:hypothetical protein